MQIIFGDDGDATDNLFNPNQKGRT